MKTRSVTIQLEKLAQQLPSTSAVQIYASLSQFLSRQITKIQDRAKANPEGHFACGRLSLEEWPRLLDDRMLDLSSWIDVNLLDAESVFNNSDLNNIGQANII